jgi:hypothetical protein
MTRYFFDTSDNGKFLRDDVGIELPDLQAVKTEAAKSLAELARDVLPGAVKRRMSVEARDERQPVLMAVLNFEAIILTT